MFQTVLIANRGEIACRIIRTCRRMGIRTVAVYSTADAHAHHVSMADEAIHIGNPPTNESYLNIETIIRAAKQTNADAIHPGYGFLSENHAFARACRAANIMFIGSSPESIEAMGNKRAAKLLMHAADVPTVPGYSGSDQTDATLLAEAERIGFPLMIKAAAGGGGKGMRLVHAMNAVPADLATARREALAAFGSDEVILERAIIAPRHIEVQILGDQHGNLLYLGERECSIQRRHQKIIEEAPSPAISPAQRAAIGQAAVAAARTVNYFNAGTVEFLVDQAGEFYFLEMNTRLQVEHPVTEMVTGLDLVEWQIRVAQGERLPWTQDDITLNGHAIEMRVYAEQPHNDFLPATGTIALWQPPTHDNVRIDAGIVSGDEVSVYYDPMLAKIIAHGPDRQSAIRRLIYALDQTALFGVTNNLRFVRNVLAHPAFIAGDLSTGFLQDHASDLVETSREHDLAIALVAAALAQSSASNQHHWRNSPNMAQRWRFRHGDQQYEIQHSMARRSGDQHHVRCIDLTNDITMLAGTLTWHNHAPQFTLTLDGHRQTVMYAHRLDEWWVLVRGMTFELKAESLLPEPRRHADEAGSLRAPMPGNVMAVLVEVGHQVEAGTPLLKLEAMKMEHTIRAPIAGTIEAIYCSIGTTVQADEALIAIGEQEQRA